MRLRLSPQSNEQPSIVSRRHPSDFNEAAAFAAEQPRCTEVSVLRLHDFNEAAAFAAEQPVGGRPPSAKAPHFNEAAAFAAEQRDSPCNPSAACNPDFNEAAAFAAEQQPLCNSFGRKACNQGLRALWRHVPVQHRTRETVVLCTQVIVGLLRK